MGIELEIQDVFILNWLLPLEGLSMRSEQQKMYEEKYKQVEISLETVWVLHWTKNSQEA